MGKLWRDYGWVPVTIVGSSLFALGFVLFLQPNDLNPGGISGLAMAFVEVAGFGSVGTLSILLNLPLFVLGGAKIGKRFFCGSLLGMLLSSVLIDGLSGIANLTLDPLIGAGDGGTLCGLGLGMFFICGSSTGGSDILVRLLKLRYRNVPIGQITMAFDAFVVVLTGVVFQDVTKALYTGVAVFITGKVIDAVVYRFDYSKVALIITREHAAIAQAIGTKLDRGAPLLHAEGSYTHQRMMVVLTAVKKQQITELKELGMEIDPSAFVIVQEAHQVLGDGFSRYSQNSLG